MKDLSRLAIDSNYFLRIESFDKSTAIKNYITGIIGLLRDLGLKIKQIIYELITLESIYSEYIDKINNKETMKNMIDYSENYLSLIWVDRVKFIDLTLVEFKRRIVRDIRDFSGFLERAYKEAERFIKTVEQYKT